jgi:hypothetical protein
MHSTGFCVPWPWPLSSRALVKANQVEIEIGRGQVRYLDPEHLLVPARVLGQLVVGDHVGALLRLGPAASDHNRHLAYA